MNNHYRYCFSCDKWKSEKEINEVDLGGGNKTFNCNVCRKDLGENIQIFKCLNHDNEILKVWGTLEGQNKEKIFYDKCPQEGGKEQNPPKLPQTPKKISGGIIALIVGGIIIIGGIIAYFANKVSKVKKPKT